MNALLCIGCNRYDRLSQLNGAEKDARDVFTLLSKPENFYDARHSRILLSPSTPEINSTLNEIFPSGTDIDTFTFFFAGHGAVKSGSFYLCSRETEAERLSTTAFSITALFSMINEFRPTQANIVVDACEAGGSSFDLAQLLKPEIIGHSDASSIIFLGACTADQLAGETSNGGTLTSEFLKCITGQQEIQTKNAFLDLIEISSVVSRNVYGHNLGQRPIYWGLSLFGNGRIARNPHFNAGTEQVFPTGSIPPQSSIGRLIRENSSLLWNEYRTIMDEFVPRRLFEVLASVYSKANRDVDGMVTLVQGLARTMSSRASESSDLHAASECIATCAASLLPHIDQGLVKRFTITASQDVISRDTEVWREILSLVQGNNLALLDRAYPFAELYYLPMRLTKILGWLGFSIIAGSLFTELNDGNDVVRLSVAKELLERYRDAFVSVSDEQAPYLYVFLNACLLKNQQAMAEEIVTLHFASFCEKKGNVNRAGSDGVRAFEYVLSLGPTEFRPQDWRPANPSHLLPVLLLYGSKLGLDSAWDLKAIDRLFGNFFIPTDYRRFADKVIEHGVNHTQHIGFGVWSLKDFKKEFERAFASTSAHSIDTFPREGILLSMMSSLLFPDRLPLLLERTP